MAHPDLCWWQKRLHTPPRYCVHGQPRTTSDRSLRGRVNRLHPISILLECLHVGKWLCLRREGCVWLAERLAPIPPFSGLACGEKLFCSLNDGSHVTFS